MGSANRLPDPGPPDGKWERVTATGLGTAVTLCSIGARMHRVITGRARSAEETASAFDRLKMAVGPPYAH